MSRRGPWRTLGIDPTEDRAAIRRAYAAKLKLLDVDREIEAYTRLRDARDQALALAARLEPVAIDHNGDDPRAADVGGDINQPSLLDDGGTRDEMDARKPEPRDPTPPEILLTILFPNGEQTDRPLEQDEWEIAARALAAIIGEAQEATVDQHGVIEEWLAHHLASAWPRSAPLLEDAVAAFDWLDEAGRLNERPAIAFINQRLRGMRFHANVQQPDHKSHKIWAELSKPGSKGAFAFMRVGKDDVRNMLVGIRAHFPEIERHLDPERVASWEATFEESPWSPWTVVWRIIVVVWILSTVARLFTPAPAPEVQLQDEIAWNAIQVDDLIIELFGERLNDDTLLAEAPDLWDAIRRASSRQGRSSGYVDDTGRQLLIALRGQTQLAARDADFETLIAIKQVKLDLLQFVREQRDAWDCLRYAREGTFPANVAVSDDLRAKERELAVRLAGADLLLPSDSQFPTTARIPGPVIEQIIRSTGLSEEVVRRAAGDRGDADELCNYRIALLEAVLQRPADVSADLLRII